LPIKKIDKLILAHAHYQTKQFHVKGYKSGDGQSTVEFIKYLQNKYKERKIILIWDGAIYHTSGEFRDDLSEVNRDREMIGQSLVFYVLPMLPNRI
jgi:3-dehydroquinate dehydratase